MLLTLTSNDDLMLMSLKDLNSKMLIGMNYSFAFTISSNGKFLMNIQQSGEILVYNLEHCTNAVAAFDDKSLQKSGNSMTASEAKWTKLDGNESIVELDKMQTKVIRTRALDGFIQIVHFDVVLGVDSQVFMMEFNYREFSQFNQ